MSETMIIGILGIIFGGGVVAVGELIRDWRHRKRMNKYSEKNNDTTNDIQEVDLQQKTLELINTYVDSVKVNTDKMMNISNETHSRLTNIEAMITENNKRLVLIEEYLNGDFKKYKNEHNR